MPYAERRAADKDKNMITISIRMAKTDHNLFLAEAEKEMRSLSNLLIVLAKRGLKAKND